jgi:hypothetical protein
MTDIITNTSGTALGSLLIVQPAVKRWLARLSIAKVS